MTHPYAADPTQAVQSKDLPRGRSRQWWRHPRIWRTEILAAIVVGIALIPEAISFSIIAHVNPSVGLFASFTMAMTISIVGGRRAMISAATGSVALVVAPLSQKYGLHYLVAAVILAGVFQVVLGLGGVAKLMRYVPRSVSIGFVNALGILLFKAQFPNLTHVPASVYGLVATALIIIALFPRINKIIPAPLVAIIVLTAITVAAKMRGVPTVGDMGKLPDSLPTLGLPGVPFSMHTLSIIVLPALTMAIVGLLETQMTAQLVDELTDTGSNKNRESWGQGIANLVTGFFGGMGGCAMIGQTMINVKAGARTRMSTFMAGLFLLILVVALHPLVSRIPMAALVAVMFVVANSTFDWESIKPNHLKRMPKSETAVMLITVILTVATGNLSIGVFSGVIAAALLFARRVQHMATVTRLTPEDHRHRPQLHFLPARHRELTERQSVSRTSDGDALQSRTSLLLDVGADVVVYAVTGELFFASSSDLADQFDYEGDPNNIVIDLTDSHIWDSSTVAMLDQVVAKYGHRAKNVELIGMNEASSTLHEALTGRLRSDL
jgi:SulP family sulfate permease